MVVGPLRSVQTLALWLLSQIGVCSQGTLLHLEALLFSSVLGLGM